MNDEKKIPLVIFALVAIVALVGVTLLFSQSNNSFGGIDGRWSEDATSFDGLTFSLKGKSRKWAADAAASFDGLTSDTPTPPEE